VNLSIFHYERKILTTEEAIWSSISFLFVTYADVCAA
jgi:hypothetical protein